MNEVDKFELSNLLGLEILSRLELPENIYLAAFLSECHKYFPSLSNSYCTLNKNFQPTDIYDEINHHSLTTAARSLINNNTNIDLHELALKDHIVTTHQDWLDHPLTKIYRKIFIRHGYHQSLIIPVIKEDVIHGFLIFNRGKQDSPFTSNDIKRAKSIKKQLNYGFLQSQEKHIKTSAGVRSGLIIINHLGEMKQCCPEGQNLLSMVSQKKAGNLERFSIPDVRRLNGVIQLIERLLDNPTQEANAEVTVKSYWGCFKINGFPVLDKRGNRAPQVYLNITWQVPFSLMLFYNIRHMGFTPRQQLIGVLYARGISTKSISSMIDLSLHTVKEHVQHIFEKLEIHSRAELIEQIICQNYNS